jgi:hypothetical protein
MLYEIATRTWRPTEAYRVNTPTWSRDSGYVYYDTDGADRALRRLRVADGVVETLFDLNTHPTTVYLWSGLAPDGSPLVLENLGARQVYSFALWK